MKTLRAVLGATVALCATMAVTTFAQQTGGLPALREDLMVEAGARMQADQVLDAKIDAETAARIAGDAALANKGCGPGLLLSGFDAQGAPICSCPPVDVRDYLHIPADYWWVRGAHIKDANTNYLKVSPGAAVQFSFQYEHTTIPECPYCLIEFLVGFSHVAPDPAQCVPPFTTPGGPTRGDKVVELTAPVEPGLYTISISRTLEYFCHPTWDRWQTYPVAAICVQ